VNGMGRSPSVTAPLRDTEVPHPQRMLVTDPRLRLHLQSHAEYNRTYKFKYNIFGNEPNATDSFICQTLTIGCQHPSSPDTRSLSDDLPGQSDGAFWRLCVRQCGCVPWPLPRHATCAVTCAAPAPLSAPPPHAPAYHPTSEKRNI
jgi:hypothetical protein